MNVSVVMCTYNGEKYVAEQLKSIIQQSYQPYEILIFDDKSEDNTVSIINEIVSCTPDINCRIYINNKCLGVRRNFQQAILASTGEYIALADQDDIWDKNKIQCLVPYLQKGYALVHSDALLIDSSANTIYSSLTHYASKLIPQSFIGYLKGHNNVTGCTCMFNGKLREQLSDFPSSYFFHDGWLAIIAYKEGGIVYCNEKLIQYRLHATNIVGINKENSGKRLTFKELFLKSKDYRLLWKKRRTLKLETGEFILVLRIWITCFTGLAYFKQFISFKH